MALLDEIEFRVYRSHIKIPLIFFVPVLCILSVYVLVYFFLNSGWFLQTLNNKLHDVLGGYIETTNLDIEPSLTKVHVYQASMLTPEREPVITARAIHATINPLLLLRGRVQFDKAHAVGAWVSLKFGEGEDGTFNLFDALGLGEDEEEEEPEVREPRGFSIGFADIRIEDSEFEFVHSIFTLKIPDVNIEKGSVFVEPATLLMTVDHLLVPTADFVFYPHLFRFDERHGNWTFTVRDFEVRNWRWANEGFLVEQVLANVEGFELDVNGRMSFPSGGPEEGTQMHYDAQGKLTAPYWSPLLKYFLRENLHFEIPELTVSAAGTLEEIDGELEVYSSVFEVAGLFFEDIRARMTLEDRFLTMKEGSARVHGGRLTFPYAYFSLLDTRYGVIADFEGVNPAGVLRDFKVDLPWLEGRARGGVMLVGEIPSGPEYRGEGPFQLRNHTVGRYADLVLTRPVTLARQSRELVPVDVAVLSAGSTAWVDLSRVGVPYARVGLGRGSDQAEIWDFQMNYQTMMMERTSPGKEARVRARFADASDLAASYGLPGLSGALDIDLKMRGMIGMPDLDTKAVLTEPAFSWEGGSVEGEQARMTFALRRGVLELDEFWFTSRAGDARLRGEIGLLEVPTYYTRRADEERSMVPEVRAVKPMDLKLSVHDGRLEPWGRLFAPELALEGLADLDASIQGTSARPEGKFGVYIRDGAVRGQRIRALSLAGELDEREVRVDLLEIDAERAGKLHGKGRYGFDGGMDFELNLDDFDFEYVRELQDLPVQVVGRGDAQVQGTGTLAKPDISGSLRLYELGAGSRRVGDVALVAHTAENTIHLAGALLPWVNVALEVPLQKGSPYYANIRMDDLNVLQAVPEVRGLGIIDDALVTGSVEVFVAEDFSNYQVVADLIDVQLESFGQTIRNRGPFVAGINNGEILQIQQAVFGIGGRFVSLQGGLVFDSSLIDVRLEGDLDLGLLNSARLAFPRLFPDFFVESQGFVTVDANIRGVPGNMAAEGLLTFAPSEIVLRPLPEPLLISSGEVRFNREGIFISNARPLLGQALGGMVRLAGNMRMPESGEDRFDLRMWSHNMSYRIPNMADLTFDTDLRLQGTDIARMETWFVSGEVNVLDGLYYRELNVVEKQLTDRVLGAFNRRAERYDTNFINQIPGLKDTVFDLDIRARDGFKLRNQIDRIGLDLELRVDLKLRNTLVNPRVVGDVEVIDGSVSFQGERFEVRSGTVRFADSLDNPWVDIVAGADVRNTCRDGEVFDEISSAMSLSANIDTSRQQYYHITLNARGNLDNLDVQFESSPYADQRDILSMLLTGCTVDQLTASSASRPTLEIALGPLLGRLEREIQDVVKVEEFTIMPGVERTQLRIGDTLTRRLSWRFQLDTGFAEASGGQQYQLEYKLSDNWSAELSERSRSETNSFLLDLKLKYRLPLD